MTALRVLLAVPGLAAVVWGVLLLLDRPDDLASVVVWAVGGVVGHDLVLAPLVLLAGLLLARLLPESARTPVTLLVVGWALVTAAVANVLSGQGGKPDNLTLLTGDYLPAWSVGTAAVALLAVGLALRSVRRGRSGPSGGR
jgi:hypothetical protein